MTQTKNNFKSFIGIDISKAKLDIFFSEDKKHSQIENSKTAIKELIETLKINDETLVVIDLTGGYEAVAVDAFFIIAAAPSVPLVRLAENFEIKFIPIKCSEKIISPFFSESIIDKNTYKGFDEIQTLKVGILLVLSADVPKKLAYNITRALWHKSNRKIFENHLAESFIKMEDAVKELGIPLHAGSKKYYKEAGIVFNE